MYILLFYIFSLKYAHTGKCILHRQMGQWFFPAQTHGGTNTQIKKKTIPAPQKPLVPLLVTDTPITT